MIINKLISTIGFFSYHWRCEQDRITHLCFADDLIIFCGGQPDSITILKQALDLFFSFSGLSTNEAKSNIFVAGSDESFK